MMEPPFELTHETVALCQRIERLLGKYEGLQAPRPLPFLRRSHRAKTIHASLAIEGNSLSLEQVSTVIDGKRISGPKKDINEVRNALTAYENLSKFRIHHTTDLLKAHGMMMKGILKSAGKWRTGSVGIAQTGGKVTHIAPPFDRVPGLIKTLFEFAKNERALSPLIVSSIVHYEIEFIHPFEDGNGRIGRLWHSVLLQDYHPAFEFVPMESVIRDRQQHYYQALGASDNIGKSNPFVEFALEAIEQALQSFLESIANQPVSASSRLETAANAFEKEQAFTRKDYLELFSAISSATASRDLQNGVKSGLLSKEGDKSQTKYRFNHPS